METTPTRTTPPSPQVEAEPADGPPAGPELIGTRTGCCGGKPHILGHRIKVEDVAAWHEKPGMSPREIVENYPTITLAQVHAALAYYYDHRDEIEADVREGDEFVETLRAGQPSIFEKARARQRNAKDDSLPPG